jgi:hypothetical protein
MAKIILNEWFNDSEKVLQFGRELVQRGHLKTADDVIQYHAEPYRWNKLYEQYQKEFELSFQIYKSKQTENFFDERFYPIEDGLESITTILTAYPSPWLVQLIGNIGIVEAELRKQIAGERGSKVHDALQHGTIVHREDYTDEEWLCIIHAKQFLDKYKPKTIINEEWVWSIEHHYAGRMDRFVLMNGKNTLIDWKTGYVGDTAWLQLAAEKLAIEEKYGLKVERWGIVGLNTRHKDGWKYYDIAERNDVEESVKGGKELEVAIEESYQYDISAFHSVHAVWKHAFKNLHPRRYPNGGIPVEIDLSVVSVDDRQSVTSMIANEIAKATHVPNEAEEKVIRDVEQHIKEHGPIPQAEVGVVTEVTQPITDIMKSVSDTKVEVRESGYSQPLFDQLVEEYGKLKTPKEQKAWRENNRERIMQLPIEKLRDLKVLTEKKK